MGPASKGIAKFRRGAFEYRCRLSGIRYRIRARRDPAVAPRFLIIGVQKAGTTALFEYLAEHPQLAAPTKKEINFFNCPARYWRGEAYYHSYFPRRSTVGDGLTSYEASGYLHIAEAPRRLARYDPSLRLVVLLRNPVARAFSAWQMYRRLWRENEAWFRGWMQRCTGCADPGLRARELYGVSFFDDLQVELAAAEAGEDVEMPVIEMGRYAKHLSRYLGHFDREQIFVERSESFWRDPGDTLARLSAFLGLRPIDWSGKSFDPVNVGRYSETLSARSRALLEGVYGPEIERLSELLDEDFSWNAD